MQVLEATYKKGKLVLEHSLSIEEGKKFNIIITEVDKVKAKKEQFFQFVNKYNFILPEDYRFNREEIYE
jgi:predicted DNA-binding antitoxin AbrB/MazE fold protein